MKFIYYAHPMETYSTYLEEFMEEVIKNYFGETLHIRNYSLLQRIVNKDGKKKLKSLLRKMKNAIRYSKGRKIHEKDAKDIAHKFMEIFKNDINLNTINVLLNPSIFSNLFIIDEVNLTFEMIGERFKKMSFPHFCYGLIECSDIVIAHGYVNNSYTQHMLQERLLKEIEKSSYQPEVIRYCEKLLQIVNNAKWNLWSPGTFNEIKYALDIRKEVYCLINKTLKKISTIDNLPDKEAVIPFDEYGLLLYSKIWQPIAINVYGILQRSKDDEVY
jgi:hypothetical protein